MATAIKHRQRSNVSYHDRNSQRRAWEYRCAVFQAERENDIERRKFLKEAVANMNKGDA